VAEVVVRWRGPRERFVEHATPFVPVGETITLRFGEGAELKAKIVAVVLRRGGTQGYRAVVEPTSSRPSPSIRPPSFPGRGSLSSAVVTPLRDAALSKWVAVGRASDSIESPGGRILLIEDDTDLAPLIEVWLARDGHKVHHVGRGRRALSMLAESPRPYDLIITDMLLPDTTGDKLVKLIRQAHATPILAMSAVMKSARTTEEVVRSGASEFISKPFGETRFRAAVMGLVTGGPRNLD